VTVFANPASGHPAIATLRKALTLESKPEQQRQFAEWGLKGLLARLKAS
jgi:hypothetical protein